MTKTTTSILALALVISAVVIATAGVNGRTHSGAATIPLSFMSGNESPVRATNDDRLDIRPGVRKIAGVTLVLRDIGQIVR